MNKLSYQKNFTTVRKSVAINVLTSDLAKKKKWRVYFIKILYLSIGNYPKKAQLNKNLIKIEFIRLPSIWN